MNNKTILVIGSGGREHALVWKLTQSPQVGQIYVAPGNAGTAESATNIPIASDNIPALTDFAKENGVDLTIVGPEAPLAAGIVDHFQMAGLPTFGPTQAAAQLEASKAFAKEFMCQQGIPTADYAIFDDFDTAVTYVEQKTGPMVVKASGLAAGKGVLMCADREEALAALRLTMQNQAFGDAGNAVVIEEWLQGPEVSLLAFSDGRTIIPMLPARDHKRAYDNDEGPNTGGMGVYAPPLDVDEALVAEIMCTVLEPAVQGMAEQGTPYVGVLYAGIMLTAEGPQALEFNCRFGDPETQVILPMLDGDLAEIMQACIEGRLLPEMVKVKPGACATVVMAAPGYPGSYPKGLPISGLDDLLDGAFVFHAGTAQQNGRIVTSGGRVLAVSAVGNDLDTAVAHAYAGINCIHFDGAHYRTDIGKTEIGD
ncbi:MAG: phosphoribosylamine--glycine ligase [Chloroflexi bacterium]|nr:phosphoribosylamine--glycine ligase [Chloroflexota bacterium]